MLTNVRRWIAVGAALCFGATLVVMSLQRSQLSSSPLGHLVLTTPTPLPPLHFVDGQGRPMTLGDFAGRVVLLNVWATWCGPCVRELPSLDRLQASLGGYKFQVVALSEDRGGAATVLPFFAQRQIQALAPYLDTPGTALGALKGQGLPTSILIDRAGREVGRMLGGTNWDSGPTRQSIEAVVNAP
jgi:thiol-disulfide isomerase/thioredoxin